MADDFSKPITVCARVSFVAVVLLTLGLRRQATSAIGLDGVVAMLLIILGSMMIGWLLGGPDVETRTDLATGTSMRNIPIALVIALHSLPDRQIAVTVAAFGALMVPPNMLLTLYQTFKARRSRTARRVGTQGAA